MRGTNEEVIRAWINRSAYEGRNGNGSVYFPNNEVLYSYGEHFPLAIRIAYGDILCNGDRYSATTSSKHQAPLFRMLGSKAIQIPFSMLRNVVMTRPMSTAQANRELREIQVLDHTAQRYIETGRLDKLGNMTYTHVLGGCLFKYAGNCYLSGIDPSGKGNGQYFMSKLIDNTVEAVEEAYESMKPEFVKMAEEQGIDVRRQGEWFFVRTDLSSADKIDAVSLTETDFRLEGREVLGRIPHHFASQGMLLDGVQLVRGIVKHVNGDHKQLKLYDDVKNKHWYTAIENVQEISWSVGVNNVD